MIARVVRDGDLRITWPDGRTQRFGDGAGTPQHLTMTDPGLIRRLFRNPELALGEGYMEGGLSIAGDDVTGFLTLVARNARAYGGGRFSAAAAAARTGLRRIAQHNPMATARRNVEVHYDLPTALYDLFLDRNLQYTCGYFADPDWDIEAAQIAKMDHIGRKLLIRPEMRVLDIGSGWGGLSIHLAKRFGAQVTGVTLSREQLAEAERRAREAGVADRVTFRLMDYRDLTETFDRIVVVGMMEHVGAPQYPVFWGQIDRCLAPDGVALVHTIGRTTPPGQTSPFIHKYIFPGGYVPALSEVTGVVEQTGLVPTDIEVWRGHYARTVQAWRAAFEANLGPIRDLMDERFTRMWRYYLAASEVSFTELGLVVYQVQLAHRSSDVPFTRGYLQRDEISAGSRRRPSVEHHDGLVELGRLEN
ncbi:cyclopropane-fatty-acyl-phospholipid synthase family protein [Maritimibacter sp. DP1N21-5]|nr:cyclopropane-fatty-acyl-phospholipid synthase family protein [Maritimibacter sp. DP1N21-5]